MKIYSGNKWRLFWSYEDLLIDGKSWVAFQTRTKPMKGGHKHNHKENALLRTKFRSKDERFRARY